MPLVDPLSTLRLGTRPSDLRKTLCPPGASGSVPQKRTASHSPFSCTSLLGPFRSAAWSPLTLHRCPKPVPGSGGRAPRAGQTQHPDHCKHEPLWKGSPQRQLPMQSVPFPASVSTLHIRRLCRRHRKRALLFHASEPPGALALPFSHSITSGTNELLLRFMFLLFQEISHFLSALPDPRPFRTPMKLAPSAKRNNVISSRLLSAV